MSNAADFIFEQFEVVVSQVDNLVKYNLIFSNCIYMNLSKGQVFFALSLWIA